jgi:hypothetical protein
MTRGLERWYGGHDLHFITCSCYQRRPELDSGERRDLFLRVLERARQKMSLRRRWKLIAPPFRAGWSPPRTECPGHGRFSRKNIFRIEINPRISQER